MKIGVGLFIIVGIVGAIGYFRLGFNDSVDAQAEAISVIPVNRQSIERQAIAVGYILPSHSVDVKSQVEGIVSEIYFREGDTVTEGVNLVKIKPNPTPQALTDAITAVTQSEASIELSRQSLADLQGLVDKNIIPENYGEYISAKADLKSKIADLEQKQQSLSLLRSGETSIGDAQLNSKVTAPISGSVLSLNVDIGSPIVSTATNDNATKLMTIADMKSMIFKGTVSEYDAAKLQKGMEVSLVIAPYPDVTITGVLTKVAVQSIRLNEASSNSNNDQRFKNGFEVEVGEFTVPDSIQLRSGFSAVAKITVVKAENVISVPERALYFSGDQPQVYVLSSNGSDYRVQDVELGLSDGITVEVTSGLSEGDMIVDASMSDLPPSLVGGSEAEADMINADF